MGTKEITIGISIIKTDNNTQSKDWKKRGLKIGIALGTGKKDEGVLMSKTLEEAKTKITQNIIEISSYFIINDEIIILIMSKSSEEEAKILREYLVNKIALLTTSGSA